MDTIHHYTPRITTIYIHGLASTSVYSTVFKWFRLTSLTSMYNCHFNHCFLQAMQIHSSGIFSPYLVFVQSCCPGSPHIAQMWITLLPPVFVLRQNRSISKTVNQANSSPTPAITVSTAYAILCLAPYDFQVHHNIRVMDPVY